MSWPYMLFQSISKQSKGSTCNACAVAFDNVVFDDVAFENVALDYVAIGYVAIGYVAFDDVAFGYVALDCVAFDDVAFCFYRDAAAGRLHQTLLETHLQHTEPPQQTHEGKNVNGIQKSQPQVQC